MPDEISSGDTTEGAVPVVTGDTAGSTEATPAVTPETGTAEASVPVVPAENWQERYSQLESKLGNWSETEKNAALYQQLSQDPRVQAALQPMAAVQTPEPLPDFSQMQPAQVMEYLDKRMEQRAAQIAEQKLEQFKSENIDPMATDVYTRQANEMVSQMETKYPDFKEHRQAIAEFLDQNPALAENLNEKSLEMAYRYVTYEQQQQAGAKEAVKKLQGKARDTAVRPQGSAPTGKAKPKTIAEAWAQTEEAQVT